MEFKETHKCRIFSFLDDKSQVNPSIDWDRQQEHARIRILPGWTITAICVEDLRGHVVMERFQAPRIEDAGLEDCALPLEAISAAFAKAAEYFSSRIVADSDEDHEDPGYLVGVGICEKGSSPANDEPRKGTDIVVSKEKPSSEEITKKTEKKSGSYAINGEGGTVG